MRYGPFVKALRKIDCCCLLPARQDWQSHTLHRLSGKQDWLCDKQD
jgi:hypothetical protein